MTGDSVRILTFSISKHCQNVPNDRIIADQSYEYIVAKSKLFRFQSSKAYNVLNRYQVMAQSILWIIYRFFFVKCSISNEIELFSLFGAANFEICSLWIPFFCSSTSFSRYFGFVCKIPSRVNLVGMGWKQNSKNFTKINSIESA